VSRIVQYKQWTPGIKFLLSLENI